MPNKLKEMPRNGRHFGWMLPKDDGSVDVGFQSRPFGDDLWEEYNRIVQVAPDLRPTVVDYLSLKTDYEQLSGVEAAIEGRMHSMPNQFGFGGLHLIRDYSSAQRALSNFLGAASAFRDRALTRLSERHGKASFQYQSLSKVTSECFDQSFAYRLLYNLRNYAQHRDSPISLIPMNAKRDDTGAMKCIVKLELRRDDLLSEKKLQGSVRRELQARAEERYQLMPLVEEYMQCMNRLMRTIIDFEADRIAEMFHYAEAVKKACPIPEDAIPVIWDGELPGPYEEERHPTVHYFSFDELELLLRIRYSLDEPTISQTLS